MNVLKLTPSTSGHHSRGKDDFYRSKLWRSFRANYFARHPHCVDCKKEGVTKEAVILDHIHQRSKGGQDFPDDKGLRGLCLHHDAVRQAKQARR